MRWGGREAPEGGYICIHIAGSWASLVAQLVKNPPAMQETWVRSLGWEDPLEKGKATHSSILAWRIPWTVESMGVTESDTTEQLSLSQLVHVVVQQKRTQHCKAIILQLKKKINADA